MKRFNTLALGLAFTIGLTACIDGTGPGSDSAVPDSAGFGPDQPFDPTALAADLLVVEGVFDSPVFVSLAESSTIFSSINGVLLPSTAFIDVGWSLALANGPREVERAGERLARAISASSAGVPVIPADFHGRTYVHGSQEGYYHDPERIGAPANGVRFILYEANPITHELGQTEIGYVDILDESTPLSPDVRVVVVSGDVEYMNYTVSPTGIIDIMGGFIVSGFFGNGTDVLDLYLYIEWVTAETTSTVIVNYSIVWSSGFGMDANMISVTDLQTQTESSTIDVYFQLAGYTVQMTVQVELTDLGENGSVEILVDSQLFATVTFSGDTFTVVGPDGEALSADHDQAVRNMSDVIEGIFEKFEHFVRPVSWLFPY